MKYISTALLFTLLFSLTQAETPAFTRVQGKQFYEKDRPYFIGANYWYGGFIGNNSAGCVRLVKELDFLAS